MNYYTILGVTLESSFDDIKRQYRKLAKQYHPDLNKAHDAVVRFRELTVAYETLLKTHIPRIPKRVWKRDTKVVFYRILSMAPTQVVQLPEENVNEDVTVLCMFGEQEIAIKLEKGTSLPYMIKVSNVNTPLTLIFESSLEH